jgi:hypothetical protein
MRRRCIFVSFALLCVICLPAVAQETDYLMMRVTVPTTPAAAEYLPVIADVGFDDLRSALGVTELPADGKIAAAEALADGAQRPLWAQINEVRPGTARLCVLLPVEATGARLVRVYLGKPPADLPAPADITPVTVRREGDEIAVANEHYVFRHNPAVQAGLPSSITFAGTGKVFEGFTLNDRVHSKDLGGFWLRNDLEPQVEVVADGPVYAEVRVSARYLGEAEAPESQPTATYTFDYFAASHVVAAEAEVRQARPFPWDELHFLELNFKDDSFTEYVLGDPGERKPFTDEEKGYRGSWGALIEGQHGLGMLMPAIVYDHKSGYGRYLHGPWVTWATGGRDFRGALWLGVVDDPAAEIAKAAGAGWGVIRGAVMAPKLAENLDKLAGLKEQMEPGPTRSRLAWLLSLLGRSLAQGVSMSEALELTETLLAAAEAGRNMPEMLLWLGERSLHLLSTGELGVAISEGLEGLLLESLFDMRNEREMLANSCELFVVSLIDGEGVTTQLRSSEGWAESRMQISGRSRQETQLSARWSSPRDQEVGGIEVVLAGRVAGDLSGWKLTVSNSSRRWSIDTVIFPELTVKALGDDGSDDMLLVPGGFGRGYRDPAATGPRYVGYYPSGGCVMQWMACTDPQGGVYVAAHDPTAATKNLLASSDPSAEGLAMSIQVPAPDSSLPGNDYATEGEMVIAFTEGGWYPATQKYRDWLSREAPWWPEPGSFARSDRPPWVEHIAAWVLTGGTAEQVVEPTREFAEFMGVPTAVHWYNWHEIPFDNDYPHYFPTKPGFSGGVAELQSAGVRVMPYINGRLWDTDLEDFESDGIKYCTKDQEGNPYIEVYGSGEKLAAMCPSQEPWRYILWRLVTRLMSDVGVDAVYMDQIAAARPRLCYDRSHGHPLVGGHWWVDGYWTLLERLQNSIAAISPDKMLTTESNAEPYARYFDGYLMCNSLGDGLLPLFPAVYGGKMLMFGRYMNDSDWDRPTVLAQKQGQLFVFGAQLWWSRPGVAEHATAGPWLRDLARMRVKLEDFFARGQMAPPPTLDGNAEEVTVDWQFRGREMMVTTPAVLSSAWRARDGRIAIPLVNITEQERTVTLDFEPERYGLAVDAAVSVQRIGPESSEESTRKRGAFSQTIHLAPLEACSLVLAAE